MRAYLTKSESPEQEAPENAATAPRKTQKSGATSSLVPAMDIPPPLAPWNLPIQTKGPRTYGYESIIELARTMPQPKATPAGLPASPHPESDEGEIIQRKTSTQFSMTASQPSTIEEVFISGRPDSAHTGTMGDHSTAFIVQKRSVENALKGKTLDAAITSMKALVAKSKGLKGSTLTGNLNADAKARLDDAERSMDGIEQKLDPTKASSNPDTQVLLLQEYVNAYLQYRELIPLTTLNTFGQAGGGGRGKGESKYAQLLQQNEDDPAKGSADLVKEAIVGLFDRTAVAFLAARHTALGSPASEVAPGVPDTSTIDERVAWAIEQHVQSINMAFPSAIKKVWGDDEAKAKKDLSREMGEALKQELEAEQTTLTNQQESQNRQITLNQLNLSSGRSKTREKAEALNASLEAEKTKIDTTLSTTTGALNVAKANLNNPSTAPTIPLGSSTKMHIEEAEDVEGDDEPNTQTWKPTMGVQIILSQDGQHISELQVEGRTPSPFKGTMGAHTTAWIVHLDAIRKSVVGKSIPDAFEAIKGRVQAAEQLATDRESKFKLEDRQKTMLTDARARLESIKNKMGPPPNTNPSLLQQYIYALLYYINSTPGSALVKKGAEKDTKTGGRWEGGHRAVLVDFEKNPRQPIDQEQKDQLFLAIEGLLDLHHAGSKQQQHFRETHEEFIREAYPDALTASGWTAATSAQQKAEIISREKARKAENRKHKLEASTQDDELEQKKTKRVDTDSM